MLRNISTWGPPADAHAERRPKLILMMRAAPGLRVAPWRIQMLRMAMVNTKNADAITCGKHAKTRFLRQFRIRSHKNGSDPPRKQRHAGAAGRLGAPVPKASLEGRKRTNGPDDARQHGPDDAREGG